MKRARHKQGSVVFDRRNRTWHFLWCIDGGRVSRKIGDKKTYPTKAAAEEAAEQIKLALERELKPVGITVEQIAESYKNERLPERRNTARVYRCWLRHVVDYWGERAITDVQPRETELWLQGLPLSPKSRSHVKNAMRALFEYAMWAGIIPVSRNPISLVQVRGVSKRIRQPRCLTVDEFHKLTANLPQHFRILATVAVSFGLRVSEVLALRWSDFNWHQSTLSIERRIAERIVDDVKTVGSRRTMPLDAQLKALLLQWRRSTLFSADGDWIFASPFMKGELPYSDSGFWRALDTAAKKAGIPRLNPKAFRHTHRSWLDAVGTSIAVQQKMMRHTDIRTTMNVYGDVVTDEIAQAHRKVVGMAVPDIVN